MVWGRSLRPWTTSTHCLAIGCGIGSESNLAISSNESAGRMQMTIACPLRGQRCSPSLVPSRRPLPTSYDGRGRVCRWREREYLFQDSWLSPNEWINRQAVLPHLVV
jgi:hypothetical protein